jgi:uncharacterized protein
MRLLTLIEAPRERIDKIIRNQRHLQQLYDNEWLYPHRHRTGRAMWYRYVPKQGWKR